MGASGPGRRESCRSEDKKPTQDRHACARNLVLRGFFVSPASRFHRHAPLTVPGRDRARNAARVGSTTRSFAGADVKSFALW